MKNEMGRSALIYVFFGFLQRGFNLLLLPFVTRVMAPQEYGAVSVVVAGGALFSIVLGSALESAIFRWTVRAERASISVLRISALYLYVLLPTIAAVFAVVLFVADREILFVSSKIWSLEVLACGLLPAVSFYALPAIRAKSQLKRFVLMSSVSIGGLLVSKVSLVIFLEMGLLGWVISDFVAAFLAYLVSFFVIQVPKRQGQTYEVRELLSFTLPLVPHRAAFWALSSLSRPAMAAVLPLGQVGLFSLGLNFAGIAAMVLVELNRAFLPKYSAESFPAPTSVTRRTARMQVAAAILVPILAGASIASFSPLLISSEYSAALPLIAVLLFAQGMYGLYLIPANYTVQSAGHTSTNWYSSVLGASFIFLAILLFGSNVGITGVSVFTFFGYFIMASVAFVVSRRIRLAINWRRLLLPKKFLCFALAAAVLMALSLCVPAVGWRVGLGVCSILLCIAAAWGAKSILRES